jgi:hypothetical protein
MTLLEAYNDYKESVRNMHRETLSYPQFAEIYNRGKQEVTDKVMSYTDDTTALYIKSQLNTGQ